MSFEYQFPDPRTADSDGLLAAGGDLSIESLVTAYSQGIFPWYDKRSPILWWSPDPRLVLYPSRFKLSDSLKQRMRSGKYEVRIDSNFETVIGYCAETRRKGQRGTWITEEMRESIYNSSSRRTCPFISKPGMKVKWREAYMECHWEKPFLENRCST